MWERMDRSQILRAFCDHFQEFIEDILRVFPGDAELRTVANSLAVMRRMNPRMIPTVFYEKLAVPYQKEIESGDPAFFIDKNWSGDVVDSPENALSRDVVLDKIERMRESVRNMADSDQKKSIQYLKNLAQLSRLYSEK